MPDDLKILENILTRQDKTYYGKYRAFVVDNKDPERRGRIKLTIPSVLGAEPSDWALPCMPYGGGPDFGMLTVPPVDAQVVVEFLEGDVSSPIWTGTFWRKEDEVPAERAEGTTPTTKILKTEAGHFLAFEDDEGEPKITLHSSADAVVEMSHEGSISLTGSDGGTVVLDASAGTLTVEDANGNSIVMSSTGIEASDGNGNSITTSSGGVEVSATKITLSGSSVVLGTGSAEPLIKGHSFMAVFNSHTHNCTAPGAPSGPPLSPLTPGVMTTATTGA
ncbi:phage baseplate assembly protein V [Palleronia caenipelagi]|uniref:Phage tail protein n=1 Tax=Palleronia caenipelagi TaxID=2489174 RepID=A0A547PPN4_9RHOB|nr:phage baseplate assembly protein V [Palleronia caenipelagi]TRD16108.1 phage tail protein [Palleronia caenipelagi]